MSNNEQGYQGLQNPRTGATELNALTFLVRQLLNGCNTSTLVQVIAVTNNGGISAVGFVDVQPLIDQQDGYGNSIPHGILHNLPYFRIQGGGNAIIIDPQIGDIGIATFANQDISVIKSTKKEGAPGSGRRFDMSDGMYLGGVLNVVPTQYIQFNSSGVTIFSPVQINVDAPVVNVNASTSATVTSPSIIFQATGAALKSLLNSTFASWVNGHVHSNGNGGANTGVPTTSPPAGFETSVVQAE